MLDTFLDHLDVLWGFLVSFAIVVVITPAVGRLARVLGVVDEPGEQRRMHLRAVPRLGGLGLFLGFFVVLGMFTGEYWCEDRSPWWGPPEDPSSTCSGLLWAERHPGEYPWTLPR